MKFLRQLFGRVRSCLGQSWLQASICYASLTKGNKLLVLALVAILTFFFGAPLLRLLPTLGGFTPDTLNAYTLGAAQYFLALTLAYVSWRWLFPSLYSYAVETMEGKLLKVITASLTTSLDTVTRHFTAPGAADAGNDFLVQASQLDINVAAERRKIATLQFTIRCVRFLFSISPLVFFFLGANAALTAALTAVPAGA